MNANQELDVVSQLDSDTLVATDAQLQALFGEDYQQTVDEFFLHKPEMSPLAMDYYLKLNPEYFKKIQAARAEALLQLCVSISKEAKN